jgi:histidyl-tRNA synthetase
MSQEKTSRPKARLPRGFRDREARDIALERRVVDTIRSVYESYGFSPLETPAFEYTDALGKFLPDVDRPNEGVFSLRDDDDQWLSLRYDLTAPLARYVAENFQTLPKPFRRYQVGSVWRNEKPGPGRFREFTQFDADTVGSASPAADAELIMMVCDALEMLRLKRGEYVVKINSRKLLDGLIESISQNATVLHGRRLTILRAVDKLDRLGPDGVYQLLTTGRKDDSGDVTKGADLEPVQADNVMRFLGFSHNVNKGYVEDRLLGVGGDGRIRHLRENVTFGPSGDRGLAELQSIADITNAAGYGVERIIVDQTVVRGLDYYTGAVFEAQVTFPVANEAGETVVFGSVAGGGRYDDLVARFTGQQVPATGISIGVSRLLAALQSRGLAGETSPLVVVLSMGDAAQSFVTARELRRAGLRAEAYVGTRKIPDQLKYADRRGAALVVMEGEDERLKGEVTIKDLGLGAELSKSVASRAEWVGARAAQVTVNRADLVGEVRKLLARGG